MGEDRIPDCLGADTGACISLRTSEGGGGGGEEPKLHILMRLNLKKIGLRDHMQNAQFSL